MLNWWHVRGEGTWLRGCRYLVSGTWYISGDNALDVRSGHTCQVCSARAHSPLQPNLFPLPCRMLEDSTWFLVFLGGNDVCFQFMPFYSNCSVVLHQFSASIPLWLHWKLNNFYLFRIHQWMVDKIHISVPFINFQISFLVKYIFNLPFSEDGLTLSKLLKLLPLLQFG